MKFKETGLKGLLIVELEPHEDERGGFARAYCVNEFKNAGITCSFVQDNISYNHKKNTIRGMHWQEEPYTEDKLVRCISGKIFDVAVDMRKDSETYLKWIGVELSDENQKAFFIPKGFAHGYQTLEDNTTVYYKVSEIYHPESGKGISPFDPSIAVEWEEMNEELTISRQDKKWKLL